MNVEQKNYDYNSVIAFTGPNSQLDQSLQKLQQDLKALRQKINECEDVYHGVGNGTIFNSYNNIYANIGTGVTGRWGNAAVCYQLITSMYANALNDMQFDQNMQV